MGGARTRPVFGPLHQVVILLLLSPIDPSVGSPGRGRGTSVVYECEECGKTVRRRVAATWENWPYCTVDGHRMKRRRNPPRAR